jgi:hypothetical protein
MFVRTGYCVAVIALSIATLASARSDAVRTPLPSSQAPSDSRPSERAANCAARIVYRGAKIVRLSVSVACQLSAGNSNAGARELKKTQPSR